MHHPVQATPDAPLVSIIIPVYNLETRVSSCLDSLLRQTWSPLEIILVNDGSTDRTAHVLNAYAALHRNITVITRDNAGVDAARYAGMDAAAGEYVMFVDGDDALFPDSVEAMVQMAARERADVVIGDYVRYLDRFGIFRRKDGCITHSRTVEREEFLASYYSGFFGMDRHGLFYTYGKMCIKLYRRNSCCPPAPHPAD
ncbi:MAG: glycosyltransferase family 2 protein [Akkermansia sp.]